MSNLVHRRRRCARIVLHSILCLEGSTPEDGGEADTQVAPVGRRMCGIPIPRVSLRSALGYVLATLSGCLLGQTIRGWGGYMESDEGMKG